MEISLENIQKRNEPYQLYRDHFKNKETRRKYTKSLFRFLKLIPNSIFVDAEIELPDREQLRSFANSFVQLANKNPKLTRNIIAAFIEEEKRLVEKNELNPNTVPNPSNLTVTLLMKFF